MIKPHTFQSSRVLQHVLSRDGNVVFALLAAISMLLAPLLPMHGASGTAWVSNDSHCVSSTQTEKGSTSGGGSLCGHCCTIAYASALPAPFFEATAPALRLTAVQIPSTTAQTADDAATLRPRVRAPPSYG